MSLFDAISKSAGVSEDDLLVSLHFTVEGGIVRHLEAEAQKLLNELSALIEMRADLSALAEGITMWTERALDQIKMIGGIIDRINAEEKADQIQTVLTPEDMVNATAKYVP